MKKLLLVSAFFLLTGCATNTAPVIAKWPEVPQGLLASCPDLSKVDETTTKLSDVLDVVINNYSSYYDCKDKVDLWNEWYTNQKKIYDSISK
jgi:hypothetical protein